MSEPLYYEKPVLLDRDKHRTRRVGPSNGFAFARKANSLYVAGGEFAEAGREFDGGGETLDFAGAADP